MDFRRALQTPRFSGASGAVLASGLVLIAGGTLPSDANVVLASEELYNPATGVSTPTGAMQFARKEHRATVLASGKVLVSGGSSANDQLISVAEIYDPATGQWTLTGVLNQVRSGHAAVRLPNGRVFVAGGSGAGGVSAEILPSGDTSSNAPTGRAKRPPTPKRSVAVHCQAWPFSCILPPSFLRR